MLIALLIGALAFILVAGYRSLALKRNWLDHPNARSSHQVVTPRGAGIVCALLITVAGVLHSSEQILIQLSFLVIFCVALTGWWDDLRGLASAWRFGLYWLSATGVVLAVYPELLEVASTRTVLLAVAASLALVWLTNLYNFMDGINGIAGIEAVFVLGAILWLGAGSPFNSQLGPLLWVALFAVIGFLFWNFPTARVFLGDAGSAHLGALMGMLILWSERLDGPSLFSWLILLGIFVVDTGYTLIVRILTRQQWHLAHRLHAYQLLCARQQSHNRTVFIITVTNIGWLMPCAWLARDGGVSGAAVLIIAYTPLLACCSYLKAGIPKRTAV